MGAALFLLAHKDNTRQPPSAANRCKLTVDEMLRSVNAIWISAENVVTLS